MSSLNIVPPDASRIVVFAGRHYAAMAINIAAETIPESPDYIGKAETITITPDPDNPITEEEARTLCDDLFKKHCHHRLMIED